MLDHYSRFFETVEINSTYYRIPHPVVMINMLKKVPVGFDFMVKVPQSFTHQRTNLEKDQQQFVEAIRPLSDSGRLSGLLAQFPYSFRFGPDALEYLSICREAFAPQRLFVEFRHNSWVNRPMYERLRSEGIGYVCVDEPQLPGLLKPDLFATTDTAYIRLHGRNAEKWWEGGSLRYDYSYTDNELTEWRDKVRKIMQKVKTTYVFFNNCHLSQAVANATRFSELLRN
jgi:uncharacterized protein YecE (DUF72 family)